MTLRQMKVGQRGRIREIALPADTQQRLAELGLLPGVDVEVVHLAPLGDPMAIECQGMRMGMRMSDAGAIVVEE